MKKLLLIVGVAAMFTACTNDNASSDASEAQEVAEAAESNETFTVNAEESSVVWKGSKITGDSHTGNVGLSSGTLNTEEGVITAGNFVIDMTSIANTDGMDEEMTGKLLGHLASPDFFDVAGPGNGTATFEVANGTADSLTGNLTIKGITKSITIPYFWQVDGDAATATSKFSIDRAQWEIKYGSSSFFDDLKDKAINDAIEFDVTLKATK
ncbi:MAG: YceI family protein [Bacteroidia bacterium]|nr:YceI family protein [Bacteroidia bacterium]NNJ56118.1 YceI family protein [Bacteroidia bacterium]